MRRLPVLVVALLLPAVSPLLLGTTVFNATLLVAQAPAMAQSAEAVAKIAQTITVRIEGATQGSGVLVKRDGNRYRVLTAWHVVEGQRTGEELDIYTPDGQRHKVEQGSIKRLGEVDMAVLAFTSSISYELAQIGDIKSVSMGSPIYVVGFPLMTSAVNQRILRFLKGDVIANASVSIANGYQLLYSNPTLPGMSGGAALNARGQLVGIHGQGETDSKMSEQEGVAVKTGTNQAVPISYYHSSGYLQPSTQVRSFRPDSPDDLIAQALPIVNISGREHDVIALMNGALRGSSNSRAYFYRALAKTRIGDLDGALIDYSNIVATPPRTDHVKDINQVLTLYQSGQEQQAVGLAKKQIDNDNMLSSVYTNMALIRSRRGDYSRALEDLNNALSIDPFKEYALRERGYIKLKLGMLREGCDDLKRAHKLGADLYSIKCR